jgi:hypothetical protein
MVDPDLAELVDQDRDALAVRRRQNAVQERGFARSEKSGQDRYGLSKLAKEAFLDAHALKTLSGT